LYERYQAFVGAAEAGMIIIPTELITYNGKKLFHIVEELAQFNHLGEDFITWLKKHNRFCNSLVDRIVPGKPDEETLQQLQNELGYKDDLLSVCEVYRLWAIEGDYHEKNILSFFAADEGVIIEPHIEIYKELKLRLLNGTHTLTCGLAYLAGFATVREGMNDTSLSTFISDLMLKEIAQAVPYPLPDSAASEFGMKVLDRFRNPYLQHQWLNISLQYTSKMKMRNIPILVRYYELYDAAPKTFALGFAAYILFMRAVKKEGEKYFGKRNDEFYPINDEKAQYFYEVWQNNLVDDVVTTVLHNQELWGVDLSHFYDFTESVKRHLKFMLEHGVSAALAASQQEMKVK
jgi:tagaturonate reductase